MYRARLAQNTFLSVFYASAVKTKLIKTCKKQLIDTIDLDRFLPQMVKYLLQ